MCVHDLRLQDFTIQMSFQWTEMGFERSEEKGESHLETAILGGDDHLDFLKK